jgi:hypothetical protein
MILGQTVEYVQYLCSDKQAFYNLVEEALALIEKAEKPEKDDNVKVDLELFAQEKEPLDVEDIVFE